MANPNDRTQALPGHSTLELADSKRQTHRFLVYALIPETSVQKAFSASLDVLRARSPRKVEASHVSFPLPGRLKINFRNFKYRIRDMSLNFLWPNIASVSKWPVGYSTLRLEQINPPTSRTTR